ncbi:hypothetical protein Tco_1028238 [Tanacetum coccineum]|uniref:Uncharacterized protein n=1 Tax=Tanacetum coccineum TaxID=301880 RepID=A0ABQ5G1U9_9ASTR
MVLWPSGQEGYFESIRNHLEDVEAGCDNADMDLLAFIQVADPTKVKVGEREHAEREAKLLDSTVWRVVPLLPVASARVDSELEASVDRLFDEGGSADKRDFAAGCGQETETELVTGVMIKLKRDHKTSTGAATGGKSPSVLKELLASSMLNVEVGIAAVATLPLVTSSVSATLEHESGVPTDSITGLNLRTIGASERYAVVPSVMTEVVVTSHAVNVPLVPKTGTKMRNMDYHHLFTEFNVGTARQACLNAKVRMRTEYCLSERKRLESECEKQAGLLKAKDDEAENLKAQLLLKETEAAKAARLRAQVSAAEATEKMHATEIDGLKQRNVALENEKDSLDGKVIEIQSSVAAKGLEVKDLNVAVSSLRSQNDGLVDQVHALETTCSSLCDQVSRYERLKEQIEEFQDAQMNIVNDKVATLDADLLEMALHLEDKFYPHLLTTISGRRWLLTHDLKLAVVKCLNSQEYLSALGAAISRAIKKGMQDRLSAGIDHGKEGRSLADVVAYNPAAEADYNSALQRLREVARRVSDYFSSYLVIFAESLKDLDEDLEVEAEEDAPLTATPPVGSPITPPPLSESSSDTKAAASIVVDGALEMPPAGNTYEVGGPSSVSPFPPFYLHGREIVRLDDNTELLLSNVKYLERCEKKRKAEIEANSSEIRKVKKCMNEFGQELGNEMQFSNLVENRVTKLEDQDQEKTEEMKKMKKRLKTLETNYALVLSGRDEWKKAFYNLQAWVSERFGRGAMDAHPGDGVDGSAACGESQPPKPPGSPSSSQ